MRRPLRTLSLLVVACVVALGAVTQAGAQPTPRTSPGLKLDFYSATVPATTYRELLDKGFDIAAAEDQADGSVRLELVLTPKQNAQLRKLGVRAELERNEAGRSAAEEAAFQRSTGYTVWRDYDGPDGIAAELRRIARQNPQIAKVEVLGKSGQGRDILGLKLTQGAGGPHGDRAAVLYSSLQHAREWIAGEVNMRLLEMYVAKWRANDREIRKLLQTTELWFLPVANPDGYQYTFQSPDTRLWRKTLRDNNENGTIEVGDGVDPNRNYPEHWNYDEEGSSSVQSSDTYRGPEAASEPETVALMNLLASRDFAFQVNYHSFGRWLLYPEGWQIGTATADDPIYYALSGNLFDPAIGSPETGDAFHPGISSDVLYVTNGETTDYAHVVEGTLAWTPELSEGSPGSGFVFPDDEALVQEEFERNVPFALSVASSAVDPANPRSHLGIETKPFYLESEDTFKAGIPTANFSFPVSYGDPQPVRVLAQRSLGAVTLKWRVNGGPAQSAPTSEWDGGERYGSDTDVYYRVVGGTVAGASPGDLVEVWFEGGGERSDSFTYQVMEDTGRRVLVVAAEDYSGASPNQAPGPHYLDYYLESLADNGVAADVYDIDAMARQAPDALGVLTHYDAVVWYTGDDVVTRELGWGPGNASRIAMDTILEMRDYLNEGGRVLYTGQNAGAQYTVNLGTQLYDPTEENAQCRALPPTEDPRRCLALHGSGDTMNDVLEYWFGAYFQNYGAGVGDDGELFDVLGVDSPFGGLEWALNGGDGADNQGVASSFISTSGILPVDEYPQFESWPSAKYDRPGGPFEPHTGDHYVYSQIADVSYKRLARTVAVPAGGGDLTFWMSAATEDLWDFAFVEVRTAGQNDWTTLPDENGNTSQSTGDSCSAGWHELHPQLANYQTLNADGSCSPTGDTGEWNAFSGNSGGWNEWRIDLDDYAGDQIEIAITYTSDWSVQGLGVFVDDVTLPDGSSTSFETDLGGWTVPGSPAGSAPNTNDWIRTDAAGFPEGAVISTPDTLYMGFGFEGIRTEDERNAVMGRAMDFLLRP